MASVKFDIGELYGRVWGGLVFPELLRRAGSVEDFVFKKKRKQGNEVAASVLGRPIQSELSLVLGNEEMRLAIPPILTIQGSINVVETVVAGLDGSVKEIASVNDYQVSIKGFLANTVYESVVDDAEGFRFRLNPTEFPDRELRQLRRFFEAKKAVEVKESRLLSFFNIKKLLIRSIGFPEMEGYTAIIPFEIDAVSDGEYTLILE